MLNPNAGSLCESPSRTGRLLAWSVRSASAGWNVKGLSGRAMFKQPSKDFVGDDLR